MSKSTTKRVQDPNTKLETKYRLAIGTIIFIFGLVIGMIGSWFLYAHVFSDVRQSIVQDIEVVSKAQSL